MTRKQEVISFGVSVWWAGVNFMGVLINVSRGTWVWALFSLVLCAWCAYDAGTAYKRIMEEDHAG